MTPAARPWRNWYHCMGSTFGTWLPGDTRGFRTRQHRQHIVGDYRFPPPPGAYDRVLQRTLAAMPQPPTLLPAEVRRQVGASLIAALEKLDVQWLALSLGAAHFHLLARFVPVGCDPYGHLA